jgi:hypothetical protein
MFTCVQGRVPIVQVTDGSGTNGNEGGHRGHESGPTGHENGPGSGPPHYPTLRPTHLFPKEGETDCKSIERKKTIINSERTFAVSCLN